MQRNVDFEKNTVLEIIYLLSNSSIDVIIILHNYIHYDWLGGVEANQSESI